MRRRSLLRALMATPLAGWLGPWLPRAFGVGVDGDPNAAAIYKTAFDWAVGLNAEDSSFLKNSEKGALDGDRADELIRRAHASIEAIRRAAAMGQCRWRDETFDDSFTNGHLRYQIHDLVRVACLSARRHAAAGRGRETLDDLFAALTLAHRVGTGGVLVARLFECNMEIRAFEALGRVLPALDRATLDDLSRRLDLLPRPESASTTIGPESRYVITTLRDELKDLGPVIEDGFWANHGFDAEQVAALRRLTGGDRDKVLAHLEATRPAFVELARRLDLSRPGFHAALDEFARAERPVHPFAASLVEHTKGTRSGVDRMLTLRSMLRAGITLICDGEAAFRAIPDPNGKGPFGLERRGRGGLIRSTLEGDRKPEVTLSIGEPA